MEYLAETGIPGDVGGQALLSLIQGCSVVKSWPAFSLFLHHPREAYVGINGGKGTAMSDDTDLIKLLFSADIGGLR